MQAFILTIGDEILLGQILDTNSRFIARALAQLGAETVEMRSVGDNKGEILQALADGFSKADAVFVTGGLGPTKDDITKQALAEFFHTPLTQNDEVYRWLQEFFATSPARLNAPNQTQAVLPQACEPLRNAKGTAPGMWFEKDGKVLVSLPGVPFETEYLFPAEVLPRLQAKFTDLSVRYQMVTVFDIPEAELALKLAAFEASLPEGLTLAYLPSPGYVRLRLTAKTKNAPLQEQVEKLLHALRPLSVQIGEVENTAQQFAQIFQKSGVKIACAESCTGGNIAHEITAVPGASNYFVGGVVSYSNEVKKNVLGVSAKDLEKYGAVSEPVACQMAEGVRRLTGADWAVATTGIAGPDGGSAEKPVGTVWIAVAGPQNTQARKFLFSRTRERNIGRATQTAIAWLAEEITQHKQ